MGINLRRADPIEFAGCVGIVREYHSWEVDEVTGSIYPNNKYEFHPTNSGESVILSFDNFYKSLRDEGVDICATLIHPSSGVSSGNDESADPPSFVVANWDYCPPPPVVLADELLNGLSYRWRGDYVTQYVNRYGGSPSSPLTVDQDKNSDTNSPANSDSRGLISYVENWNEPDAWWVGGVFIPEDVYATFTSVDYDGFAGLDASGNPIFLTGQKGCNGSQYNIGLSNLGSNAKFVMAGLSALDECYFRNVINWFEANRTQPGMVTFPYDVINFHHYSDGGFQSTNPGISPEEDGLQGQLKRLDLIRDNLFDDKELWLSEFGYNTLPGPDAASNQNVVPILTHSGVPDADRYEVQGQWIVRSFLAAAAADFDKAFVYEIRDATNNPIGAWDLKCGLLESMYDGFQPKKSWFYTYSLKNILAGMDFVEEIQAGNLACDTYSPRIYRFAEPGNPSREIFAIWSPTSCNQPAYDFQFVLPGATAAHYYKLEVPSITGIKVDVQIEPGNMVTVPVSERPIFLVPGQIQPSDVKCPINLMADNITCSSVTLYWDIPPGVNYDHYQLWYGPVSGIQNSANPDIFSDEIIMFDQNLSGGAEQALIGNLSPMTDYYFYIVPHDEHNSASWCGQLMATTTDEGCNIPIDYGTMVHIYESDGVTDWPPGEYTFAEFLFDDQNDVTSNPQIGCCYLPVKPEHTYEEYISKGEIIEIDLGEPYDIDVIYIYDGEGVGDINVSYKDEDTGAWLPYVDHYISSPENLWVTFANETPPCAPIRYLRVWNDVVEEKIGELILCGKPMSIYEISADFSYTNDCATYFFESDPMDEEFDHEWDFGGDGTSTDVNPTHTFSSAGTYIVKHVVSNLCNSETVEKTIVIDAIELPNAIFSFEIEPCSAQVNFVSEGDPADDHLWDFGLPGNTSTEANPVFAYPDPVGSNSYTVTHTVTNNCGTAVYSLIVVIDDWKAYPAFSYSIDCGVPAIVTFQGVVQSASNTHLWDFGDAQFSTDLNPVHPYDENGTYTVIHTVIDACGHPETESIEVIVDCSELEFKCPCTGTNELNINAGNGLSVTQTEIPNFLVTVNNEDVLPNTCLSIKGRLILDQGFDFSILGGEVRMQPGSEIVVQNGSVFGLFFILNNEGIHGCEKMWRGISVESGGRLNMAFNIIQDAQYAVNAKNNATLSVRFNTFDRNYVGIYSPPSSTFQTISLPLPIGSNSFTCTTGLLQPFPGQSPYPGSTTFAGIFANNTNLTIGSQTGTFDINTFSGIRNGIVGNGSLLSIFRTQMSNFVGSVQDNMNVPAAGSNGVGIHLTNSFAFVDDNTITGADDRGIHALRSSVFADGNNINTRNGIVVVDCNNTFLSFEKKQHHLQQIRDKNPQFECASPSQHF